MEEKLPSLRTQLTVPEWKEVEQRLLFSKELFLHGREHNERGGSFNRMIAVQNVHNAVELLFRTILYACHADPKGGNDPGFEDLMKKVEDTTYFKEHRLFIPSRTDLIGLNRWRNLVVHQTVEPLDIRRWITTAYTVLSRLCLDLFSIDFETLTALALIDNLLLKSLLSPSTAALTNGDLATKIDDALMAFDSAAESLLGTTGDVNTDGFFMTDILFGSGLEDVLQKAGMDNDDVFIMRSGFQKLTEQLVRTEHLAVLTATGVSLANYRRLWHIRDAKTEALEADAEWLRQFVIETIVSWQTAGLSPVLSDSWKEEIERRLEQRAAA